MADVSILLTFDDGPHQLKGINNRTTKALNVLQSQSTALGHPLAAVFFVQTHATDSSGRPLRLNSPIGAAVAKQAVAEGHLLQIHTGSRQDHASHVARVKTPPYDINNDNHADGQNGLESDLLRAVDAIGSLSGTPPKYVRSTFLERNAQVNETYQRIGLKHIGANVVSGDADSWTVAEKRKQTVERRKVRKEAVIDRLSKRVKAAIDAAAPHIIVLFHELHPVTAESLSDFIDLGIKKAFVGTTATPKFVQSRTEALSILSITHV